MNFYFECFSCCRLKSSVWFPFSLFYNFFNIGMDWSERCDLHPPLLRFCSMIVENWWRFRLSFGILFMELLLLLFINIRVNFMRCSLRIFMIIESEKLGYWKFWKKRKLWSNLVKFCVYEANTACFLCPFVCCKD